MHRVGPQQKIKREDVSRCFELLNRNFTVIKPSDLGQEVRNKHVAVVTIDDGHVDAYQTIYPIAKKYRIPIALCVPTDFFFFRKWLWFDQLAWARLNTKKKQINYNGFKLQSDDPETYKRFSEHLKRYVPEKRDHALEGLLKLLDLKLPEFPPQEYRAVTKLELEEMLESGLVEVVGHTVTHTISTVLGQSAFETELKESKQQWESFLGYPMRTFCYPNGYSDDFDPYTKKTLKRVGFHFAFTSIEGTNLKHQMDPFEISRVHLHPDYGTTLKLISGFGDLIKRVERIQA